MRILRLLILIVFLLQPSTAIHAAGGKFFTGAAEPIQYLGRVQRAESVLWTWPATGFRVIYNGSRSVRLRFHADNFPDDSSADTAKMIWYRIDDRPWGQFAVEIGGTQEFTLNTPNDKNRHLLRVVKASEGQVTFDGLTLDDTGLLAKPPALSRRIEFVGDSITAGFRINGMGSFRNTTDHDATHAYSWLLGEKLNAEVRLIAVTAHGLVHNYGSPPEASKTVPQYYPYLHREYDVPNDWSWQPDTIIVNLGTNDIAPPEAASPGAFQDAYATFLATLRRYNPQAMIIALQPFGVDYGKTAIYPAEIRAAVKIRQQNGDGRVFYVDTVGWLGEGDFTDGSHPNPQGHRKAADRLATALDSFGPITISAPGSATALPCAQTLPTRLTVGKSARVTVDGRGPSPLLDKPDGQTIANAAEGTLLDIFDGPRCEKTSRFWLVHLPDGSTAWIRENNGSSYFIEPLD
jgi:lysophospholipase L1-like esterase